MYLLRVTALPCLASAIVFTLACGGTENPGSSGGGAGTGGGVGSIGGGTENGIGGGEGSASAINAFFASTTLISVDSPKMEISDAGVPKESGDFSCSTVNVSETKQFDKVVAYANGSDVIWAGGLLRGDSVDTGQFTPIAVERKPLTISVSLQNLSGSRSRTIDAPSLSTYRDALDSILAAGVTGATAAQVDATTEVVSSDAQLALALGAKASWGDTVAKISASFDFAKTNVYSRHVVNFVQTYYTVDIDTPVSPDAFFGPTVTVDELKLKFGETTPGAYISSVTYGRMVVFTIESKYSSEEIKAALDVAFKAGTPDIEGNISATHSEKLTNSTIKAFILGGSGSDAVKAISSFEALKTFIEAGGNYSKDSPGAPIAYKLRYLKDNSPRLMSLSQDYSEVKCDRVRQQVELTLNYIKIDSVPSAEGGSLEIFGNVAAWTTTNGVQVSPTIDLMKKASDEYVDIAVGQRWPPESSDPSMQSTISRYILNVQPNASNSIAVHFSLWDQNAITNDFLGDITSNNKTYSFAQGWRQADVPVSLANGSKQITAHFSLKPL